MDTTLYLTFLVLAFGVIVIPGPNVLVIVSTSITHGRKRGLQTVAGTSIAMAIQLIIVASSTAWLVQLISEGLNYLKWLGVAFLLFLGIYHLKYMMRSTKKVQAVTTTSTFSKGFVVSLSNPKTFLFFSAFFPQFVVASESYFMQMILLSSSFLVMATVLDSCYALMSSKLSLIERMSYMDSLRNGVSGLLYVAAGMWLVITNRSS